jgi:hypothetical protein
MSAAEIVKPQLGEAELAGSPDKLFRDAARVSRAREVECLLTCMRGRSGGDVLRLFRTPRR